MYRASDDALLATEDVPSEGTHDPADIFDLTALDEVDVYFEMATEPTDEYTTPAFVAPTIASAHISDTQGGTVITEDTEGATLWAVENDVTGYPAPTLAYQWFVNASPAGGTDDEESFDTTGLEDGDAVTVEITVTNAAGDDDATSAAVDVVIPVTPVTWNPADKSESVNLSNGNLTASRAGFGWHLVRATKFVDAGKWYFEVVVPSAGFADNQPIVGVGTSDFSLTSSPAAAGYVARFAQNGGGYFHGEGNISMGYTWAPGDVLGFAVDGPNDRIYHSINGVYIESSDPVAGTGGHKLPSDYTPAYTNVAAFCDPRHCSPGATIRSTAGECSYSPPSGYAYYAEV